MIQLDVIGDWRGPVLQEIDLFGPLWSSVGWLLPAFLIFTGTRMAFKARAQGWLGEFLVARSLDAHTVAGLHDVILPDGRGGFTQIDHILLTKHGIWVVETKNFTGRIFGRERDRNWTQRFGSTSFRISNPLRQNYGHLKAVEAIIKGRVPVFGRVVMAGSATFPKGMPFGVSTRRQFRNILAAARSDGLIPESWMAAWRELETQSPADVAARKTHRAALQKRFGRDIQPMVGLLMLTGGLLLGAWMVFVKVAGG